MPKEKKDGEPASSDADPGSSNQNHHKKYGRRQIRSNWDRYQSENLEDESVGEKKGNDFADLASTPSDCNYFQFKSEKNWENEASYSTFSGHKFLNLNLEVLSNGLACLPFYERVDIDKSLLSKSDIERCDRKANECLLKYKVVKENFIKNMEKDYELPKGLIEEIGRTTTESKKDRSQVIPTDIGDIPVEVETLFDFTPKSKLASDDSEHGKNVSQSRTEEESLEDWLDSVLDD